MQNKAYKYAFNVDIATWICLYSAMPVKGDNGFFLCVTETTRAYITGILLEVYSMFRNSAGIHKSFHNGSTVYCSATFPTFKRARLGRKKKKKRERGNSFFIFNTETISGITMLVLHLLHIFQKEVTFIIKATRDC